MNPADFMIAIGSPAIDAGGIVDSVPDFAGNPVLGQPDIGAYEFGHSDTDNDGLIDYDEVCYDGNCQNYDPYDPATSPTGGDLNAFSMDTDGDGYRDGTEINLGSDPLDVGSTPTIVADGDVNLDGQVNVADILLAQRSILGLTTLTAEQIAHGDYRPTPGDDGLLGLSDLILIIKTALSAP